MKESQFIISFPDASAADANQYAADLAGSIRDSDPHVNVEQRRDRDDSQDLGVTVVLVLGTASVTAVAQGIASWLGRHSGAKIQVNADGSVLASDLDSRDASRIAEAFSSRKRK
jgi:hypothetical protein